MKTIFLILCGHIGLVSSLGLDFGSRCDENRDCRSQQCTPVCESEEEKMCTEPDWFFLRHERPMPSCVKARYRFRKASSLGFGKPRRIGHSCHSDVNCNSNHCVPMCDEKRTMWRCIEPRPFFIHYNLDRPRCTDHTFVYPEAAGHSEGLKTIGKVCSEHAECYTKHCAPVCESDQKRCVEPMISFTYHDFQVPECYSKDRMNELIKEVNDITNAPDIDEVERKTVLRG